jgi:NTE family protein
MDGAVSPAKGAADSGGSRPISLALQGGGAHGAFEWGVLDRLLEHGGVEIKAVSAASAGAMNAVALAAGLIEEGPAGARAKLESFWRAVSHGSGSGAGGGFFGEGFFGSFGANWMENHPAYRYLESLSASVSPYDFNPLNYNPLADILSQEIDFAALRDRSPIALYISATNVRTCEAKVFRGPELTAKHIMASACLPVVFQAVEIEGEDYWDGGYLANPPIWPLAEGQARDVMLILLNPLISKTTPRTASEIADRIDEIAFNAPLAAELRVVAAVQGLIAKGDLVAGPGYQPLRFHMIAADGRLSDLKLSSKFNVEWSFLNDLKARGRAAADDWLKADLAAVGQRSSVDLGKAFL